MKRLILCLFIAVVSNANALVYSENVTIDEIISFQNNNAVYFTLSNGTKCYILNDEKNMYSLILAVQSTRKVIDIHCFDTEENTGGFLGHRTHRIIAHQ